MKETKEILPLDAFRYGEVKLTDSFCAHAYEKEKAYLKSIDIERLLAGFRETAGIKGDNECYGGWESTEIKGHTMGHYLSALSQAYAYESSDELKEMIDKICKELKACQRKDGYLFASSEEIFDRVENHKPAWVPWYTMHKILSGLLLAYKLGGNQTACEVADRLGDWISGRCSKWNEAIQRQVLSVEYGGMNDCLYELYEITHKAEHLQAAYLFDELPLFEKFYLGKDELNGLHANTTIPKVIGAMHRYKVTGEKYFLRVAENFWEIVVKHHTYITGGNSEWEHFGEADVLDGERTACNCETCNTYNMLKLTQMLFEATGKRQYASFYEKTWINAILSSQNPTTGMTTYFQPMETGFFKVYGTPYDRFWCCTGTGMENFTKLHEGIFYHREHVIYINRYISSQLCWKEEQLSIEVKTDFPDLDKVSLVVKAQKETPVKVCLYIPEWLDGKMEIWQDGSQLSYEEQDGYAVLMITGEKQLMLHCPMKLSYENLPDNPLTVAFKYGPIVLSSPLGKENMKTTVTGVDVLVAVKDQYIKDYIVIEKGTEAAWLKNLKEGLVKEPGQIKFHLKGTDEDSRLSFIPHYSQYQERYGIYWRLCKRESEEDIRSQEYQKWKRLRESLDCIQIGNDQYELAHKIRGEKTESIHYKEHRGRVIQENGWVSYELSGSLEGCRLNMVFCSEDEGKEFEIWINQQLLMKEKVEQHHETFYTKAYEIPGDKLEGKARFQLLIKVEAAGDSCRIFDEAFVTAIKQDK